jgi:pyridoxine 4-dehydrogenase
MSATRQSAHNWHNEEGRLAAGAITVEPHFQTRRGWLLGTGAALSALVCAPLLRPARAAAVAAGPSAVPAAGPARPAQGAGTFAIGGDLTVNRLGFGAMRVTGPGIWGQPSDPVQARAVLRRVVELGVNLIDTADAYGPEVSEQLIYETLHPYPADLLIATKGGLVRPSAGRWDHDGRPEHLRTACEASLRRLHLERIGLYQLHAPDPAVPIADSLGELGRLQSEGKIRHIGVSNFDLEQLKQARGVVKVVSIQNRYNIGDRDSEPVLKYCEQEKIGFLPWGPLGEARGPAAGGGLAQVAAAHNITMPQAALAWLLAHSPVMLPIPGTSSVAHLEEDMAAAQIKLTPADLAAVG